MPLRQGYSRATIARNVAELRRSGRPAAQAEAIAYREARAAWRQRHPRGPWPAHLRPTKSKTRQNPATSTRRASRAYEAFHGDRSKRRRRVHIPDAPPVVWELGRVIGISYETTRDGERAAYLHKFKPGSAPRLVISEDGEAMFLADGRYKVTDRGIEDR